MMREYPRRTWKLSGINVQLVKSNVKRALQHQKKEASQRYMYITRYYRQKYYNYIKHIHGSHDIYQDRKEIKAAQLAWFTYMHSNYPLKRPYVKYGSEVKSQFPR